jgi:hypothetical protein
MAIAAAVASPTAGARVSSVLVYSCGPGFASVCQINADGGGQKQLMTSSRPKVFARRYGSPSLSRDGRKLAYLLGYGLHVRDLVTGRETGFITNNAFLARISPDGTKVGDLEEFGAPTGTLGWVSTACVFNSNGSGAKAGRECEGSTGSFAFTNDNRVLASASDLLDTAHDRYDNGICLLDPVTSGCDRFVASDLGHDLADPTLSPSGTLLAVTRSVPGQIHGAIAVYDYATGKLVRMLTAGTTDSEPVWSPDGSRIAFVRGASTGTPRIYTIAAKGGSARQLVARGRAVSWGQ